MDIFQPRSQDFFPFFKFGKSPGNEVGYFLESHTGELTSRNTLFYTKCIIFINSMQDFEIHGRTMQLGWGQESREENFSNKYSSVNRLSQQQHDQVKFETFDFKKNQHDIFTHRDDKKKATYSEDSECSSQISSSKP